jgi:hypothetical protein
MKRAKAGTLDWKLFLTCWSQDLMESELAPRVEPPPQTPDWLGYAPATAKEIKQLEDRLGVPLPPSYKAFLRVSNGWRRTTAFIGRIRPTSDVNWFRVENEHWAECYAASGSSLPPEEYYVYGTDGAPDYRAEHLASLLQISDVEDGVYLLNPEAVTPDGEWEAWFLAHWVPGANRFPSFAHLMLHDYQTFTTLEKIQTPRFRPPRLHTPGPNIPRGPAARSGAKLAKAPGLDVLISEMRSTDAKTRARAVRTLGGKLRGRRRATRRPDLVPALTDLFYATADAGVRSACVAALSELAEDSPAPAPLFDALSDNDPSVVLGGIFALTYFPDARAVCRFIESGVNVLINESAMAALGEIGDDRAVPTLVKVLLDTRNAFDQSFGSAALGLARCGPHGFDALAAALGHEDARVRLAAVVGLANSRDPRVQALLGPMEHDLDPRVRERARIR